MSACRVQAIISKGRQRRSLDVMKRWKAETNRSSRLPYTRGEGDDGLPATWSCEP